jgi:hypothetical protein
MLPWEVMYGGGKDKHERCADSGNVGPWEKYFLQDYVLASDCWMCKPSLSLVNPVAVYGHGLVDALDLPGYTSTDISPECAFVARLEPLEVGPVIDFTNGFEVSARNAGQQELRDVQGLWEAGLAWLHTESMVDVSIA